MLAQWIKMKGKEQYVAVKDICTKIDASINLKPDNEYAPYIVSLGFEMSVFDTNYNFRKASRLELYANGEIRFYSTGYTDNNVSYLSSQMRKHEKEFTENKGLPPKVRTLAKLLIEETKRHDRRDIRKK
jgi:hypothetical protein